MLTLSRRRTLAAMLATLFAIVLPLGAAQRTAIPRDSHHPPRPSHVAVRGEVIFIGGYYYDPFFGPYPWWPRPVHFPRYFPAYDYRAEVRVLAEPKQTAVYVDGFYAGIVDDFDGIFQKLLLPPGGHEFTLYLAGYRTARYSIYVQPGSSMNLHHAMEQLPAADVSEPPPTAAPVPPPPEGTYRLPKTPPPIQGPAAPPDARGYGALNLRVQPADAAITVDGQRWLSADGGHFVVELVEGRHHVDVARDGYLPFSTDIDVRERRQVTLNVALAIRHQDDEGGSR